MLGKLDLNNDYPADKKEELAYPERKLFSLENLSKFISFSAKFR